MFRQSLFLCATSCRVVSCCASAQPWRQQGFEEAAALKGDPFTVGIAPQVALVSVSRTVPTMHEKLTWV